ncbi:GNAT family N-acetyltransferase [Kiloniella majae]|uniref:GNAT family N-acetyltransferase n=1 Tax=Kiloniella majae TaxID=1938558 RepID=UPI000A278BC5|nr:N-acetyltransferase [Kiloniella majae]
MNYASGYRGQEADLYDLFSTTFTVSEGADEGRVIRNFVQDLMKTTPERDLFCFSAHDNDYLVGSVFFSSLKYKQDDRTVFILSPMAVKPDRQKNGIGQKLIIYGLEELRKKGVDIVVTYGDINFYSKVGFQQISEEFAQAPLKLSYPEGWLAQSLTKQNFKTIPGSPTCVDALNKPELW